MARRQQNQQQQTHHEVQGTIGVSYGNLEMGQPIIIEVWDLLLLIMHSNQIMTWSN